MKKEHEDLEGDIRAIREKVQKLQEGLEENEAMEVLEEAVVEVERFGGELEEADS